MSQAVRNESFIDNLHRAISEDTIIASESLKDNKERWQIVSESIASIADALFTNDNEGRRSFINEVLGIEVNSVDEVK
jgi:hypothetical protein